MRGCVRLATSDLAHPSLPWRTTAALASLLAWCEAVGVVAVLLAGVAASAAF